MSELEQLRNVLRELVEDTGDVMPGWSLPMDCCNYACSYCGAMQEIRYPDRYLMIHDEDCPVNVGMRLLGIG
jgi:glutamate synthase domain-containing protein 1